MVRLFPSLISRAPHCGTVYETDLDDRIASAFADGETSHAIAALIVETEGASVACGDAAARARQRALDPVLSAKDVAEARRQMEDAAFRRERLQIAVARLQERLKDVRAEEEDQRRWAAYNKAKAERDKLAVELTDTYPAMAKQLVDLLTRIEANDRAIERINAHALPNGAKALHVAEQVARGVGNFIVDGLHKVPRITKQLRLPAFTFDKFSPFTWPEWR